MKSRRKKNAPLQWGCQLPKLSVAIPLKAVLVESAIDDQTYVRDLLEIGVIDPSVISTDAGTPRDILKQGLTAWFKSRTKGLRQVNFHLGIDSAESARAFIECSEGGSNGEIIERSCLVVRQHQDQNCLSMRHSAQLLEKSAPGLFRTALKLIERSSYLTVAVRTPEELWEHFCYSWYGTDSSEVNDPDDVEHIVTELKERLGEDASIAEYMPELKRKLFGFEFWGNDPHRPKQRVEMSIKELDAISQSVTDPYAKDVAAETALLKQLLQQASEVDAKLPQLDDFGGLHPIYTGVCLQYADDHEVWGVLDDLGEMMMNSGDNCEYHGIQEIPQGREELTVFFEKLDLAFRLLSQMDKVIDLISDERDFEQGDAYDEDADTNENEVEISAPARVSNGTSNENTLETTT